MKRQYLQSLPKATDIKNEAYNVFLAECQKLFAQIQQNYDKEKTEHLWEELKKLNDVKPIKKVHKKPIYEYFLKKELETLNYIKGSHVVDYGIMKLTKCKLEDFKVDWKQLWERILKEVPETSANKSVESFIKQIRQFFDENNELQVWQYFQQRNHKDMAKVLTTFVNINQRSKQQLFQQYVQLLINKSKIGRISKIQFLTIFLSLQKYRKHITYPNQVIEYVNDLVLQFILANEDTGSKKSSFESNFNSSSAELLEKVLGKANPVSIKLLDVVFGFVKRFIKPLQNSTKSTMFIYWLFKALFKRVQTQKKTRVRLMKLLEKNKKKKQEQEDQEQQDLEPETKEEGEPKAEKEDKDKKQQNEDKDKKPKEQNEDNDDDDEDFEQDEEEQDEEDLALLTQVSKISFEKDQDQKGDTDEQKKQKMQKLLANEISNQILNHIEKQVEDIFQILYYVNSKKTISHLLRYIYRIFPKFVIKSLDTLNKAVNIPSINEDGLVKNLTVTVEHMFMPENYKDGIKNVMRVLEKAYNCRRIVDVWNIYEAVGSKIPMLDQKDLQNIPDKDKEQFEKTFGINHDRFYTDYSDHMVQAFKRLLKEGEHLEESRHKQFQTTMAQTYYNSYPQMRKRILDQVMEELSEKISNLALLYFNYAELPTKQYEILINQFAALSEENRDIEEVRLQLLCVLTKKMTLQELKPFIIKMAQKGHFKIVEQYAIYRIAEQIKWEPKKTTLNYLYQDPKITIEFANSVQQRKKCLKQLMAYRDQLIEETSHQIDKIVEDAPDTVAQRVIKSYTTPAKISTLAQRKKIYELLSIVGTINSMMEQKLINIKTNKKLQLVDSEVSPYGFLDARKPFSKQIKKLVNSQQVLHDPKLISILNTILTNEYFMYFDIQMKEDKKISKEKKRNKNHESTDCVNRIVYGSEYVSMARNYMAQLLYKTHGGNKYSIEGMTEELFILSMVNSNEAYKDIRSMFQWSGLIGLYRKYLISVMAAKVENRELIKRISSTIDFLTKREVSYLPYTDQQVLQFVAYHATLIQSQQPKIKQNTLKSFRKFSKIIGDNPIRDALTQSMLKYRKTDKMEIIWMIYVAAVVLHPDFLKDKQLAEKRIMYFLQHLQGLILHDTRSTRRISLYLYPIFIRTLKKLNSHYETKTFQNPKYEQKSLQKFIETGFIRPQFENKDLKEVTAHKKHPQPSYEVKTPYRIPGGLFDFLINDPEKATKFIKNFHSDLASTTEMMISAMQSAATTIDLFTIATKSIQTFLRFYKTKDMAVSRGEPLVGVQFFKYLCMEDAYAGFKFFATVKDFVLSLLNNMESLDNQTVVILYAYSLLNAYEATFTKRVPQIEQFLAVILQQIIKKSSKLIYSKLQTLFFKKIRNREAVKFIEQMCVAMIKESKKIYRTGYLLAIISGKNYESSENLLKKMLDENIELEQQSNIVNMLTFLLTYPKVSVWNLDEIKTTGILDVQKLKQQNKVKQIEGNYLIFSNKQLQDYIIKTIKRMVESQSIETVKTGFNILSSAIKSSADLYVCDDSTEFVTQLLRIWARMLKDKSQLQLDFEAGNKAIGYLLNSWLFPTPVFEKFLVTILDNIQPTKKYTDLMAEILNSPLNYIKISNEVAEKFVKKLLSFETNSALYKPLLKILATFFRYRVETFDKLNQSETEDKNRRALLLQAYLLAENVELKPDLVKEVLKISSKDRKNLWAREMLLIRGQREYFDNEKTYEVWREIKQLSNPYHYHA